MRFIALHFGVVFALLLVGCASSEPDRYGLVGDVKRYGGGQYYVDGVGSYTSPHVQALNQCRADGNKQLQIISNTFAKGALSGEIYPALIFKCVGNTPPVQPVQPVQPAQPVQPVQPVQQNTKLEESKQKLEKVKVKMLEMCNAPELAAYYKKTSCKVTDITFEQVADVTKITASQKVSLAKQRAQYVELQKDQKEALLMTQQPAGQKTIDLTESYLMPQTEQNGIDLYNGKITWGDYNKRRKEIYAEFMKRLKE